MLREKSLDSVKIISIEYDLLINKLKEIAGNIKKNIPGVEKILLFGSFAKGNYTPSSDLDILIIVKDIDSSFLCRSEKFIKFFREIPLDVNMLVYTDEEIERLSESNNMFIREVLSYAKEL